MLYADRTAIRHSIVVPLRRLAAATNRATLAGGITAAVYLVVVLLRLAAVHGNASVFVFIGDGRANPALVPPGVTVFRHSLGYDGQYFYRLALDPFTARVTSHGIRLDNPAYRQQRIVYPLLAWALSLGQPIVLPQVMLLLVVASVALLGWVGGLYAQALGRHALLGLSLAFYPGFVFSVARDLPEPLAVLFAVGGLLLVRRRRFVWATVLLCLAVLTRETMLLVAAGVLLAELLAWRRGERGSASVPWYCAVVPLVTYAVWQGVLWLRWGAMPALLGSGNLSPPFGGPAQLALKLPRLTVSARVLTLAELAFLLLAGVAVALALRRSRVALGTKLGWALFLLLTVLLGPPVWHSDWGFMRVLAGWYAMGALVLLGATTRLRWPTYAASGVLWLTFALTRLL